MFLQSQWSVHPAVESVGSDLTIRVFSKSISSPAINSKGEEWDPSQQMGWQNVAGAGDLNEYELQRAQITWCSKAVRNIECQNHLADI